MSRGNINTNIKSRYKNTNINKTNSASSSRIQSASNDVFENSNMELDIPVTSTIKSGIGICHLLMNLPKIKSQKRHKKVYSHQQIDIPASLSTTTLR